MKARELIDALHKHPEKDVLVRLDNGLFCRIVDIKLMSGTLIINSQSPGTSAKSEDFKPLEFGKSVEKIYIREQEK